MANEKLSAKEKALIAEARRAVEARKVAPAAAPASPSAGAQAAQPPKPAPSAAERLAQLMADERAETQERKKKMRRYGLAISSTILAAFVLWLFRAIRPRR